MDGNNILTPGEIGALNILYDARDKLRQTMERWDNRLTLEGLSFPEDYVQLRCSIILKLRLSSKSNCIQYAVLSNTQSPHLDDVVILVTYIDACDGSNRVQRDQQPVFVDIVQCVESTQGIIPSFVRLYDVEKKINEVRANNLYYSFVNGLFEFLPSFPDREFSFPIRCFTTQNDQIPDDIIQCRTQVLDGFANDNWNRCRGFLGLLETNDVFNAIHIFIDAKTVEIRFEEHVKHRVQLENVLIGPLGL